MARPTLETAVEAESGARFGNSCIRRLGGRWRQQRAKLLDTRGGYTIRIRCVCSNTLKVQQRALSELFTCAVSNKQEYRRCVGVACSVLLRSCSRHTKRFAGRTRCSILRSLRGCTVCAENIGVLQQYLQLTSPFCALSLEVLVDVKEGGSLEAENVHGNHPSGATNAGKISDKIVSEVTRASALVFHVKLIRNFLGVRVSPLGVVEEPKCCTLHDRSFLRCGKHPL